MSHKGYVKTIPKKQLTDWRSLFLIIPLKNTFNWFKEKTGIALCLTSPAKSLASISSKDACRTGNAHGDEEALQRGFTVPELLADKRLFSSPCQRTADCKFKDNT